MTYPLWIVVANSARARFLVRPGEGLPLTEVSDWVNSGMRMHLHPQDLGTTHRKSGIPGRRGLAPRSSEEDKARGKFAQAICQRLTQAVLAHEAEAIAFFASNPFLGELLGHAQGGLEKHLHTIHALDLTALALTALDQQLAQNHHL